MKKKILALGCITLMILGRAQNPTFQLAEHIGSSNNDVCKSIVTDNFGNVYMTGQFLGTVDFDPGPDTFNLSSPATSGIFISKFDNGGNLIWAKSIAGSYSDNSGMSIALDANGNVYTTGIFSIGADFDPGPNTFIMNTAYVGAFILKLDPSGNFIWAKSVNDARGVKIAVDASGNVFTTGYFHGGPDFDPGPAAFPMVSQGSANGYNPIDIFILKLNASGNFVWAKRIGGNAEDAAYSMAIDESGNIYTTGVFRTTCDFDPGESIFNLTAAGYGDVFILKLNAEGNFLWVKQFGGVTEDYCFSMVLDAQANIYTTGWFSGNVDFDPGAQSFYLNSPGAYNTFISKLDQTGKFVWAKSTNGTSSAGAQGNSIAIDLYGDIYTTGFFYGSIDFDPGFNTHYLSSEGAQDIYISKLSAGGNFISACTFGGTYNDIGKSITVDDYGNIFTTGSFNRTVDFNPGKGVYNLSSAGLQDIFLHKMSQPYITNVKTVLQDNSGFSIYPSPANTFVNIELSSFDRENNQLQIQIIDTFGHIKKEENIFVIDNKATLNTGELPNGIYIILLKYISEKSAGNQSLSKKIIVSK